MTDGANSNGLQPSSGWGASRADGRKSSGAFRCTHSLATDFPTDSELRTEPEAVKTQSAEHDDGGPRKN
ncbi:hypothetical protein M5D96_004140 [Drosophila gunungcola]|uniref:Uncharacterized protein n=1 Tax=Drosophila gunungcola TaxID=103775 RepID=A0A9Q0BSC0_9MUSC|nr:hypothetical protein M5D96_004140 [Drosophila gunungcola]